jgi:hypothetical protein
LNRDLIWAGSDTGLIHITRDGGKNWKDVTPPGLSAWSKISLIEASHFNPAVAYAAVDRSRLDDQNAYIYRTRDYGVTWQRINDGISAPAFARAIREDSQSKGLLFAGTQMGVYVSVDDGDHWQSLQLNLPATSVPDLVVHGDDLVIATHGRSFWILDNITPLRQALEARRANASWLYRPATAIRVDSDSFSGTPIPPEEPTAENPPNGAMIDYFLPTAASSVQLEIFDAQQKLVRRFSADDHSFEKMTAKRKLLPIAERWFPQPRVLTKTAGMHRFVWDLTWSDFASATSEGDSEGDFSAPKVVPGIYQARLTVDGRALSQTFKVVMDPRSSATPELQAQQFQLARQIFSEARETSRAMSEIGSVQKQLAELQQKPGTNAPDSELKASIEQAQSAIAKILSGNDHEKDKPGLQEAFAGLTSALRVVEGGDRAIPSQALAVYKESSPQAKARIAEWNQFKQTLLPQLNEKLRQENLGPVAIQD